jgi:hypothetical protein
MTKKELRRFNLRLLGHSGLLVQILICVICGSGCARKAESRQPMAAVRISSVEVDAAEPSIAASPSGAVYVAWVEHVDGGANVMVGRFDQTVAAAVRVNAKVGEATAWRGDPPSLAAAPDGILYVVWTSRLPDQPHATDLYMSVSRDNGRSFEAPVRINADEQSGPQGMHSLAIGPQGTVYVAWLEERKKAHPVVIDKGQQKHKHEEANREVFVASSKDGGKTFSSKTQVASDACPCCKTSLSVAPDGRIYASWRQVLPGNFRHIAVASSADQARTFSTPVIVSDDRWMLAGCPVSGSSLSVSSDGTLQVLWYADGQVGPTGVYRSESRDGGRSFTPRQLIAEGMTQGTPLILRQGDRAKAIWQRGQGTEANVVMASIDSKGAVTGSTSEAANSQLPAASMIGDQLLIVSIRQAGNDRRSVWLVKKPAA